ncbi:unnamed protein product [Sphagnum balticum]
MPTTTVTTEKNDEDDDLDDPMGADDSKGWREYENVFILGNKSFSGRDHGRAHRRTGVGRARASSRHVPDRRSIELIRKDDGTSRLCRLSIHPATVRTRHRRRSPVTDGQGECVFCAGIGRTRIEEIGNTFLRVAQIPSPFKSPHPVFRSPPPGRQSASRRRR